jgi:hypothetical protein
LQEKKGKKEEEDNSMYLRVATHSSGSMKLLQVVASAEKFYNPVRYSVDPQRILRR